MQIDGYKCPNCGGTVKFDSSVQKMACPYCDAEFELAVLEEHQRELNAQTGDDFSFEGAKAGADWENPEADDLATGCCPSCGAEIIGDQNTIATVCPCCGNAQIVSKRLSGMLKPDFVIPFKLEKDAAIDALKKFCKGKHLLPKTYLQEKRVQEMQGIYAPFWLFDATAHGHIRYKATKTRTWSDSKYTYTKTDFYSIVRDGSANFEKIPVDASEKLDDKYMDAMEPFNYGQMQDFHPSFLAGYLAEKYDVDADKSKERAGKRMKGTIETEFRKSVSGYTTVLPESSSVSVKEGKVNYALFPVWIFNTKYRQENYQFMMNGQTGRLVGRLPIDRGKAWSFRGLFTSVIGAILTLLVFLFSAELSEFGVEQPVAFAVSWIIAILAGFGVVYSWCRKMDNARLATCAGEYMVQGSLKYSNKSDKFLYSTTRKIPRMQKK